jgi:predicted Zn finger-like uncharacterized protein
MVITCPSCSARYRLNPEKVKGRGAKITCPKCSHIFVVFADGASSPGAEIPKAAAAAAPSPKAAPPPTPAGAGASGRVTAGEVLKARDKDTTTGAFRAVGLDDKEIASPATTGKIRVVAPGPRKTRRKVATIDTNNSLPALERPEGPAPVAPLDDDLPEFDGPEPGSAAELDFREVGITTWKVKVAIGLIYDFSDIATLKKYLADKKVTEDDLISHDGKAWVRIGDIPDLDQHFIETWKAAKVAASGDKKPKAAPKAASSEAKDGDTGSAAAAYGSGAFPNTTGAYGAQTGSYGAQSSPADKAARAERKAARRAAKAASEERKPSKVPLLMLAGVIVLTVVAWFLFANPDEQPVVTTTDPAGSAASSEAEIDDAERARIRREVREQVEAQRAALIAEQAETDRAAEEAEATPILEAVTPSSVRVDAGRRGSLPAPIRDAPTPTRTAPSAADTAGSQASVAVTATDRKGSMYFDKGKQQYTSGNYGSAKTMLVKAVSKCPECGEYWEYLGKTLQELGEVDEAAAAFAKAQTLGVSVNTARP